MKKGVIIAVIIATLCGGYFVLYHQANSELKLAELKSDLDGMYSSLERLSLLMVPSAQKRLDKISHAIVVRQEMLRAVADHDHELAVISAGELIELVPHNTDAIRTLRESGQIFYLLRESIRTVSRALDSNEPAHTNYETVKFEDSSTPNSKNTELVRYLQTGLNELGYYSDDIDGLAGQSLTKALSNFRESEKISSEMTLSDSSANKIAEALALKAEIKKWKEKKFFDVNRARELAQKAVDLDPRFERAQILADDLDQAHEAMAILLSANVFKTEQQILSAAASVHDSASSLLGDAVSSRYGSVSGTYQTIEPFLNKSKRLLSHLQEGADESMRLISTYKGTRSKEYFDNLRELTQIVKSGVNSLLVPTGNLMQFRQAASNTVQQYSDVLSRLTTSMPNSAQMSESVTGFTRVFSEYQIFNNPNTESVIDEHTDLYKI